MEQWEKEYLENLQKRKSAESGSQGYSEQQKEYINTCWEEVIRDDGSKWYIPKQDKIQKRMKQLCGKKNRSVWAKKMVQIVLAVYCFYLLFANVSDFKIGINTESLSVSSFISSSVFHRFKVRNTMVDGLGLKNMLDALWNIRDRHLDKLNSFVSNSYSFTDEDMDAWLDLIDEDLVVIGKLPHDNSYSEVIDGYVLLLNTLKAYIQYALAENWALAEAAYVEYAALLLNLHNILAGAFEKNGVDYTLDEDGIRYTYYHY